MSLKKLTAQGIYLSVGIFLLLLFNACSRTASSAYHPNDTNLMAVSEKGDLKVAGFYFAKNRELESLNKSKTRELEQSKKYNLQFAFSPINKMVVTGSHYKSSTQRTDLPVFEFVKNSEISLGFYNKYRMLEETDKSFLLPDVHLGFGSGNISKQFETAGLAFLDFQRYFLQGGLHFSWKGQIKLGIGLRYVRFRFKSANLMGKIPGYYQANILNLNKGNQKNILETSFQIQGGIKLLKVFVQATSASSSRIGYTKTGDSFVKVGLILELDEMRKKLFIKDKK